MPRGERVFNRDYLEHLNTIPHAELEAIVNGLNHQQWLRLKRAVRNQRDHFKQTDAFWSNKMRQLFRCILDMRPNTKRKEIIAFIKQSNEQLFEYFRFFGQYSYQQHIQALNRQIQLNRSDEAYVQLLELQKQRCSSIALGQNFNLPYPQPVTTDARSTITDTSGTVNVIQNQHNYGDNSTTNNNNQNCLENV